MGSRPAALLCVAALLSVSGCASVSEGVTRAMIDRGSNDDAGSCEIVGPRFDGLETFLEKERMSIGDERREANPQRNKVLMVHGIGTHPPGYSARFQSNLVEELGLSRVEERVKHLELSSPEFPDEPLGELDVYRYVGPDRERELLFYELSWAQITQPKKSELAYDTSGPFAHRRASINAAIKRYLNDRLADPMIYLGTAQGRILGAVDQGVCWMLAGDWDDLPEQAAEPCDYNRQTRLRDLEGDNLTFVTHSLGSRLVIDALEQAASTTAAALEGASEAEAARTEAIHRVIREKSFTVYMLANQLPLLALSREPPPVIGQIDAYCRVDGSRFDERMFRELMVVAFSDPNDVLSYAIPWGYDRTRMDSRLCPRVVNVSVNVTPVVNLLRLGEIANPLRAHDGYDADPRVISLIARGAGVDASNGTPDGTLGCSWLETIPPTPRS